MSDSDVVPVDAPSAPKTTTRPKTRTLLSGGAGATVAGAVTYFAMEALLSHHVIDGANPQAVSNATLLVNYVVGYVVTVLAILAARYHLPTAPELEGDDGPE